MFNVAEMNTRRINENIQENQKWFSYVTCDNSAAKTRTRIKTNPWVVSNAKIIIPNVSKIIIYDKDFQTRPIQGKIEMQAVPDWMSTEDYLWGDNDFNHYRDNSPDILSEYAKINYTTKCNNCMNWNCLQEKYSQGYDLHLTPPWTVSENLYLFNLLKMKLMREFQTEAYPNTDIHPILKLNVQPRNTFTRALWNIQQRLSSNFRQFVKENKIINNRVKQLKEEERIQFEERQKYQRQATQSKKKALLLQTLRNLRSKLEDQHHCLQRSYSKVMDMQANMM